MTIDEYFKDWMRVIPKKEMVEALDKIKRLNKTVCPMFQDIFKAFTMLPLNDLKVVFLGQDPYPDIYDGIPRATGILFGNRSNIRERDLSASLKVVKESVIDFEVPHNILTFDNSLESWARQGILMLNSALTCEVNKVGSHTMIWRPFISKLLENISLYDDSIIFVLFGEVAQSFIPYIKPRGMIIETRHPAYYARVNKRMSNIFKEINRMLGDRDGVTIRWYLEEV